MPALSKAQQRMMAVAEHDPGKVKPKNRGVLAMGKGKLSEFASTPRNGLPEKVGKGGKLKRAFETGKK